MSAIFEDMTAAVGCTPLVRINKLGSGKTTILAKLESYNPCGSKGQNCKVDDRSSRKTGADKTGHCYN